MKNIINSKAFFQEFSIIVVANLGCLIIIPIVTMITGLMLTSNIEFFVRTRNHIQRINEEDNECTP